MKKYRVYIINILLIIGIFNFGLIINNVLPFGEKGIAVYDGYYQYQSFLYDFMMNIKTGNFTLFEFNSIFGNPVFFNYMYYLSSPLNFIALLSDKPYVMYYLVIIIKLLLGSICSTFYFSKKFNDDKITIICTLSYIFSGWFLAYYFSILWLDVFGIFPLLQYSLERMLKEKKIILSYIFILAFCILCNFHLSTYICFYILFYFWIYHCLHKGNVKDKLYSLGKFILCTILSFLLIMVFMYPVIYVFINKMSVNQMNSTYLWQSGLKLFSGFLSGTVCNNVSEDNYIYECNLCISMFLLINCIYFFFNKNIKLKKKITGLIILLVSIFLLYCNVFTYTISGLYQPVCFNYRYSFIISFLMIMFGINNYISNKDKYDIKRLLISCFIILIIIILARLFEDLSIKLLIYNIVLLVLYFILLISKKNNILIVLLVIIECLFNFSINTKYLDKELKYGYDINNNHMYINANTEESLNTQYYFNDSRMNIFSSSNYNNGFLFLKNQGYAAEFNHTLFNFPNSELYNLLFNINGEYRLNKVYGVSNNILNYKYNEDNLLDDQENIANLMIDEDNEYFDKVYFEYEDENNGFYHYIVKEDGYYTFVLEKKIKYIICNGNIYLFVDSVDNLDDFFADNKVVGVLYKKIYSFEFKENDDIYVYFEDDVEPELYMYQVNDNFYGLYNRLKENEIVYETFKDDYIDGYIYLDEDQVIFTTLVYDEDWEVYVDGNRVEPIVIMDTFIGIETSSGKHRVTFKYKYHHYGSLLVSMITLCGLLWYHLYRKSK